MTQPSTLPAVPTIVTHNGPFHADDVLATALIRHFAAPEAKVIRSRDREVIAGGDIVVDVGGVFDQANLRFDHHQREYEGERSSAGMVLDWLESSGRVDPKLAELLRERLVDYVDAVDVGARQPEEGVPCFSMLMGAMNELAEETDFDGQYELASRVAQRLVRALAAGHQRAEEAAEQVKQAMDAAAERSGRVIWLPRYIKWKPAYFELGGETHPTEFVAFPGNGDWRIVTIPVEAGSREDKRKLPSSWAGLSDEALEEAAGIKGAKFCHRNRFIAAFDSREALENAVSKWGIDSPEAETAS